MSSKEIINYIDPICKIALMFFMLYRAYDAVLSKGHYLYTVVMIGVYAIVLNGTNFNNNLFINEFSSYIALTILTTYLWSIRIIKCRRIELIISTLFYMNAIILVTVCIKSAHHMLSAFIPETLYDMNLPYEIIPLYFMALFFGKNPIKFSLLRNLHAKIMIISYPIFIFVCCQVWRSFIDQYMLWGRLGIMCLSLLIINSVIYFGYAKFEMEYVNTMNIKLDNQWMRHQLDEMERSELIQEQIRRDTHELKNQYFNLKLLLDNEDYVEMKNIIDKAMISYSSESKEIKTGNIMVDKILSYKQKEASQKGVYLQVDALLPPQFLFPQDEMCSLLFNLLDNAVENCDTQQNAKVCVKMDIVKNYLHLVVTNPCKKDVLKYNPELKTTKEDQLHHGLGIRIIKEIINRRNGMINLEESDGFFTVNILLELGPDKNFNLMDRAGVVLGDIRSENRTSSKDERRVLA